MNIAVYCSSREGLGYEIERQAQIIGTAIGRGGHRLVYGGVNAGLMHVVAQAAHDAGASVTGVIPRIFSHRADPLCDDTILTADLNERKGKMIALADVFIVLPGGLGTIDEWMSTLSDIIVREREDPEADKPIYVLNYSGMYDGLIAQLRSTALSPFARGKRIDRSLIFADADALVAAMEDKARD